MPLPSKSSFFSINFGLILTGEFLPYDLFINSSTVKGRERFVRVFPQGDELSESDLETFKKKYQQLYVPETQREDYFKSLVKSSHFSDEEKATVIKDSAIAYLHRLFDEEQEFNTEVLTETIHGCRESVESMVDVLEGHNIDSLRSLIGGLSYHDFYTYDHSINVSMYCIMILRSLNPQAGRAEQVHAGLGGLLHDIGKMKIPTHILNYPGKLSDDQYSQIKKHPEYGHALLLQGEIEVPEGLDLNEILRVVHEHHENYDGRGYPNQLSGEQISLFARICTVADFFDAVTTKRSYSESVSIEKAIDIMAKTRGKKVDPKIFDALVMQLKDHKPSKLTPLALDQSFDPSISHKSLPFVELKRAEKKEQNSRPQTQKVNMFNHKQKKNQKAS